MVRNLRLVGEHRDEVLVVRKLLAQHDDDQRWRSAHAEPRRTHAGHAAFTERGDQVHSGPVAWGAYVSECLRAFFSNLGRRCGLNRARPTDYREFGVTRL